MNFNCSPNNFFRYFVLFQVVIIKNTITTLDNKPSAHFEHDVAIVNGKPELLSTFKYVNEALGIITDEEDEFRQ